MNTEHEWDEGKEGRFGPVSWKRHTCKGCGARLTFWTLELRTVDLGLMAAVLVLGTLLLVRVLS